VTTVATAAAALRRPGTSGRRTKTEVGRTGICGLLCPLSRRQRAKMDTGGAYGSVALHSAVDALSKPSRNRVSE
jgi:hypothetical protein